MDKKTSPSCCKVRTCRYNPISPGENSQECIACPYLLDKKWEPVIEEPK